MILTMIILFALGYMCIALEHRIKIDKSATALAMFAVIWSVYALASGDADTGRQQAAGAPGQLPRPCRLRPHLCHPGIIHLPQAWVSGAQ